MQDSFTTCKSRGKYNSPELWCQSKYFIWVFYLIHVSNTNRGVSGWVISNHLPLTIVGLNPSEFNSLCEEVIQLVWSDSGFTHVPLCA
jgi:hypothetical protein